MFIQFFFIASTVGFLLFIHMLSLVDQTWNIKVYFV